MRKTEEQIYLSQSSLSKFDKLTLHEKIDGSQNVNKADELIERLLQDKNALSRLKAELKTVC